MKKDKRQAGGLQGRYFPPLNGNIKNRKLTNKEKNTCLKLSVLT